MNPTTWRPRTARDAIAEGKATRLAGVAAPLSAPLDESAPTIDNPPVRCDVCRRTTQADMLFDVSALPESVRGAATYACDHCRELWTTTGRISHEELWRAIGAPDEVVALQLEIAARLAVHQHGGVRQARVNEMVR